MSRKEANVLKTSVLANREATTMIAVSDLEKAREVYEDRLGLEPLPSDEPEVQLYRSATSRIAVYLSEYAGTNQATAVTWEVDDLEGVIGELKAHGVTFEPYDLPGTTRTGDVHMAGRMKVAWFKDPDGNILSIVEEAA